MQYDESFGVQPEIKSLWYIKKNPCFIIIWTKYMS